MPLVAKMPSVYAPVRGDAKTPGSTFYRVFVGGWAPFVNGVLPYGMRFQTFTHDLHHTILIVEAGEAVPWTKPDELVNDPDKPLPKLGGMFPDGFHAAFADGSVRFIPKDTDQQVIRAFITMKGDEDVALPGVEVLPALR